MSAVALGVRPARAGVCTHALSLAARACMRMYARARGRFVFARMHALMPTARACVYRSHVLACGVEICDASSLRSSHLDFNVRGEMSFAHFGRAPMSSRARVRYRVCVRVCASSGGVDPPLEPENMSRSSRRMRRCVFGGGVFGAGNIQDEGPI